MAVPKKKTSVSRKGKRRAGQHHKLYDNVNSISAVRSLKPRLIVRTRAKNKSCQNSPN